MSIVFSVFWALSALFISSASAQISDRVAAVVNDEVITLSEVYDLGAPYIREHSADRRKAEREVLETLIAKTLKKQEMRKLGMGVPENQVEAAIADIAKRNGLDSQKLRAEVERSGLSWLQYKDQLRDSLREQQFTQYIMQTRISIDENELQAAYLKATKDDDRPEVVDLGAIFLPINPGSDELVKAGVLEKLTEVSNTVNAAEDHAAAFSAAAKTLDQAGNAERGGHMGRFHEGELISFLDKPAFVTAAGQCSEPVITEQGIFLLFVFSKDKEGAQSFDQMRPALEQQIYASRVEDEVQQWVDYVRRQAAVEIKLPTED